MRRNDSSVTGRHRRSVTSNVDIANIRAEAPWGIALTLSADAGS